MPITFWTRIGGFALAGFPFITTVFGPKDEILADAWANNQIVFYVLVISATLTAFYTMRQIALTFPGEPRTLGRNTLPENVWTMTYPLIFLAIFALFSGFVGVPKELAELGFNNFGKFVSATLVEELAHSRIYYRADDLLDCGGAGWLGFGMVGLRHEAAQSRTKRSACRAGVQDLTPCSKIKYYFDELYEFIFGRPARWIASVLVYQIMDRTIIDGALMLIARFAYFVGHVFKVTEKYTINDPPDWGLAAPIQWMGRTFRVIQTGRVQNYLLVLCWSCLPLAAFIIYDSSDCCDDAEQ